MFKVEMFCACSAKEKRVKYLTEKGREPEAFPF